MADRGSINRAALRALAVAGLVAAAPLWAEVKQMRLRIDGLS